MCRDSPRDGHRGSRRESRWEEETDALRVTGPRPLNRPWAGVPSPHSPCTP